MGQSDDYYQPPEPDFPDGCPDCEGEVDGDRWEAECIEPQSAHDNCEDLCNCDQQEDPPLGCGWSYKAPAEFDDHPDV